MLYLTPLYKPSGSRHICQIWILEQAKLEVSSGKIPKINSERNSNRSINREKRLLKETIGSKQRIIQFEQQLEHTLLVSGKYLFLLSTTLPTLSRSSLLLENFHPLLHSATNIPHCRPTHPLDNNHQTALVVVRRSIGHGYIRIDGLLESYTPFVVLSALSGFVFEINSFAALYC
jgi:hypothetical protein